MTTTVTDTTLASVAKTSPAAARTAKRSDTLPNGITLETVQQRTTDAVVSFAALSGNVSRVLAVLLAQFAVLTAFSKEAWKAEKARLTGLIADGHTSATLGKICSQISGTLVSSIPECIAIAEAWTRTDSTDADAVNRVASPGQAAAIRTAHNAATGTNADDGRGKSGKGRKNNTGSNGNKSDALLSPSQILAQFMRHSLETRASILNMLTEQQRKDVDALKVAEAQNAMVAEVDAKLASKASKNGKASK